MAKKKNEALDQVPGDPPASGPVQPPLPQVEDVPDADERTPLTKKVAMRRIELILERVPEMADRRRIVNALGCLYEE